MQNLKLIIGLSVVIHIGMNIQAAESSNYQYGQNVPSDDLAHFHDKYIGLLVMTHLQLNDDGLRTVISEAKEVWNTNDWSGWIQYRDFTEFDFVANQLVFIKCEARKELEGS